ncbi:NAD(P)H dehydrogenase (quinone) [Cyclobacterium lianum]|uniref:NAD(P)H dehydrogenase (Quinone) n=1 Tax=Cyclobacterium lianum TaxID=388280 RepID=A0A1M7QUR0_9BACT|nr:flavodoxin family protein [Cyclobacterium lianum]SHN35630.1 NAD(P)H dehydrogenase (quinone) [Cyclobacterium lianum]
MKNKKLRYPLILFFLLILSGNVLAHHIPSILIAYYSGSGNTKAMAEAVARGVEQVENVSYTIKCVNEVSGEEVLNASAIILGSPVYNANIAPQVQEFINSWPFEGRPLKNKIGAVFVTGGGFSLGEESVMFGMIRAMLVHGMLIIGGAETEAAFGASAITGEGDFAGKEVDPLFLKKAEGLGKRVAELVLKMQM